MNLLNKNNNNFIQIHLGPQKPASICGVALEAMTDWPDESACSVYDCLLNTMVRNEPLKMRIANKALLQLYCADEHVSSAYKLLIGLSDAGSH